MSNRQKVACIVNCFDTYSPRAELISECLEKCGFTTVLVSSDWKHIAKERRKNSKKNEVLVHVPPYIKNISVKRIVSHRQYSKGALREVNRIKPDLLWVLIPPNSLAKTTADWKSENPKTKLIFDVIDLWPETMPYQALRLLGNTVGWNKKRDSAFKKSDYVVTECNLFQERLAPVLDAKMCNTLRYARKSRYMPSSVRLSDTEISICYLGSVNHTVDIQTIGVILRTLRDIRPVTLHIIGAGERINELVSIAESTATNVRLHGAIYDWKEKQQVFDCCHYGLNVMRESVCVGLTMKSIDYFDAGLPIINTIKGDTWEMVEQYGVGVNWPNAAPTSNDLKNNRSIRMCARKVYEELLSTEAFFKDLESILDTLAV